MKPQFRQPIIEKISGPEGIRTPGLLSAIEARSQLRYRPGSEEIVSDPIRNVKTGQKDGRNPRFELVGIINLL
jgi:hypothetical protein